MSPSPCNRAERFFEMAAVHNMFECRLSQLMTALIHFDQEALPPLPSPEPLGAQLIGHWSSEAFPATTLSCTRRVTVSLVLRNRRRPLGPRQNPALQLNFSQCAGHYFVIV